MRGMVHDGRWPMGVFRLWVSPSTERTPCLRITVSPFTLFARRGSYRPAVGDAIWSLRGETDSDAASNVADVLNTTT